MSQQIYQQLSRQRSSRNATRKNEDISLASTFPRKLQWQKDRDGGRENDVIEHHGEENGETEPAPQVVETVESRKQAPPSLRR